MIFANADFDIAFIYKDYHVDMIDICYYDCILAWRCLKENEPQNDLKTLYWKYPNKQQGSPKKFSDFFDPRLFPFCRPEVAKLYAANDDKITFELFKWQLPFITKSHPKCQKHHLEKIADLVWNIEFPLIKVCALMHRIGVYYDRDIRNTLKLRYDGKYSEENAKLAQIVQEILDEADAVTVSKSPFKTGRDFNEGSPKHVTYLLNQFLHLNVASGEKKVLEALNMPLTNQILKVRKLGKLLNSFIDKLPDSVGADGRIHATLKSIGADTGRWSCANPNMQQIPSHATDIRHQFRATPSMEKIDDCSETENGIEVTIGLYDIVYMADNTEKEVIDLQVGDSVKLLNHNKEVIAIVKSISNQAPDACIRFDV